jgi:CubicO group peptidase (beta-lactamase class C family)
MLTMKKRFLRLNSITFRSRAKAKNLKSKGSIDTASLKTYFENSNLPAALMGYSKSGKIQWYAYGPSVWGGTDTVSEDHIFRIFSKTKAIATVAALQLVERDLIGLDDPLDELMPEMTTIPVLTQEGELIKATKSITLRHLLTHTAGFGYDFFDPQLQGFDKTDWNYEDLPRLFEAGEQWHYGTSMDWVGKIIEKISGENLETYFRENVTGPLKMNSTWFNVPENLKERIVSWGMRSSDKFQEHPRIPPTVTEYNAGGGLYGSPKDYLTFLQCLVNKGKYDGGQLLKPKTVEMMFKNQLPDGMTLNFEIHEMKLTSKIGGFPDRADVHGFGFALEANKDEMVRTNGAGYWAGIANSYYTIDKEKDLTIVYFTQFLPFNDKVSYDFYRLFEKQVYSSCID